MLCHQFPDFALLFVVTYNVTAVHGQQLSYFGCGRKEVRGTAGQRLQLIIPVTPAA